MVWMPQGASACCHERSGISQKSPLSPIQVLDQVLEIEKIVERYESLASELLEWIEITTPFITNQKFANSLSGVQQQLQAFTAFCTLEKPLK